MQIRIENMGDAMWSERGAGAGNSGGVRGSGSGAGTADSGDRGNPPADGAGLTTASTNDRLAAAPGRRDLLVVLALTLVAYALASQIELSEWFADWALGHELWQADELPFTLLALCAGLLWYARRRDRERAVAQGRNQELARHLMQVQESERRRLARELHDEFGQHCAAIRFEAQCLQRGLAMENRVNPAAASGSVDVKAERNASGDPASAAKDAIDRSMINASAAISAQAIADSAEALQLGVRRLLRQLRPVSLDTLGVDSALDELVADWQQSHRVRVERSGSGAGEVGEAEAITVFRIVQEALTNVARHAQATEVSLWVTRQADSLLVAVADNGVGIGIGSGGGGGNGNFNAGLGITGMRERAVDLGGRLSIANANGTGTRTGVVVRLWLPLANGAEQ